MIGTHVKTKTEAIVKLIDELTVDEPYNNPNLFQEICENVTGVPTVSWEQLLKHSYTPTYIKTNVGSFVSAVKAIVNESNNEKTVRDTILYTYNRLLYDKNKKRVFIAVVETLLPVLMDNYKLSEAKTLVEEIVLTRDNIALLEANLLANMQNYTQSLVAALAQLSIVHCSQFFEILCTRVKTKNRNKLLLMTYLAINNNSVDCNAALLEIIAKHRIYQIKEDQDEGSRVTLHFSQLLLRLEGGDYCRVAVKVLPLNYAVVSLERACSYCDDELLAQLVETYYKVGKLLLLFQSLVQSFSSSLSIGQETQSRLASVSSRLTKLQTSEIVQLFCASLEEHAGIEGPPVSKKQKRSEVNKTDALAELLSSCCTIVLINTTHNLTGDSIDLFERLFHVTDKLAPSARDTLKLFFSDATSAGVLPQHLLPVKSEVCAENREQLELQINNLRHSETPAQATDTILSYLPTYPAVILSNIPVLYSSLRSTHLVSIARYLLANHTPSFLHQEIWTRLVDLHSVLIVCVLDSLQSETSKMESRATQQDLTISAARDIVQLELSRTIPAESSENIGCIVELLTQIPMTSSYLRLLVTTWILSRRHPRYCSILSRFCKPPVPHPSLPVVHAKQAGTVLQEMLTYWSNADTAVDTDALTFLRLYLKSGAPINSVDVSLFLRHLCDNVKMFSTIVDATLNVLVGISKASLYHTELESLNASIAKSLELCGDSLVRCQLVCGLYNLASILSAPVLHFETALSTLASLDLDTSKKLELAQTVLGSTEEKEVVVEITNIVLQWDLDAASHNTFKSDNIVFINTLITSLPNRAAEVLLNQCVFRSDMIENIDTIVPLVLLPKLMPKMRKKRVLESIYKSDRDAKLLSKCLLCMVQSSYPIHLFNSIFNIIFTSMAMEKCVVDSDVISNIVRSCELIGKQREVARHHAPYILLTIFEHISKTNAGVVSAVTPAVYPLFEVCIVQGFQFLQARLSPGAKQLFKQTQEHYKQNVKYQGKA